MSVTVGSSVRPLLFRGFFFAVLIFLLWQLLRVFAPFFSVLAGAATIVLIFHPLHARIVRALRGRSTIAATLSTVCVLLLVILPVLLLVWLVFREVSAALPHVRDWVQSVQDQGGVGWRDRLPESLQVALKDVEYFLATWGLDLREVGLSTVDQVGEKITAMAAGFVRNAVQLGFAVAIMSVAVFFFFRDGAPMVRAIISNVPMERAHVERIVARLDLALAAVVRGVLVTAVVQGVLNGIGFAIVGLPFAVLAGFVTSFFALIPFVGAAFVWIPATLYLFATGSIGAGIFMLAWGLLVSTVDNFLKPLLIGGRVHISTFLLFFGILGGLKVYGFLGILIGPVLIAVALTFLAIYREEFRPASSPQTGEVPHASGVAPP